MDLHEFFLMGGHGAFVWGAYGMTGLLLTLEVLVLWRSHVGAVSRMVDSEAATSMVLKAHTGSGRSQRAES